MQSKRVCTAVTPEAGKPLIVYVVSRGTPMMTDDQHEPVESVVLRSGCNKSMR